MVQVHPPHGFGQASWFGWIEGFGLLLKVDIAIGTGAGAGGTHNQKRGCSRIKAFADIGTGGLFANRVQPQIAQNTFDVTDPFPLRCFNP